MARVFSEITINGLTLPNRLVRSATWEGMCDDDGRPTAKLSNCYVELARGGIGLIISGYCFIRPEGRQLPGMMGLYSAEFEREFRELTSAVHGAGGRIVLQMVHAGGQTSRARAGHRPVAPSAVPVAQYQELPEELDRAAIGAIVEAFADCARRARDWGFDGVQLHGAHGYLINQFLSPLTNRRTDEYGGDRNGRCRFLLEVYRAVRDAVGTDYPVLIKLNAGDNLEGGLDLDDASHAARLLAEAGIDAIEVSSGTIASGDANPVRRKINSPEREGHNLAQAAHISALVNCPVIAVGGFRSWPVVEAALRDSAVDCVALSRPLIREPHLPRRWREGDHASSPCVSCLECFNPGLNEGGIYCVVEKKQRVKAAAREHR